MIDRLETRSRSIEHGKSRHSAPEVFFSQPQLKTSWPTAERAPRSTQEKTSGTQGSTGADSYKIQLGRNANDSNKTRLFLVVFFSLLNTDDNPHTVFKIVLVNLDGSFLLTVQ